MHPALNRAKAALDAVSSVAVIVAAAAIAWSVFAKTGAPVARPQQPPVADVSNLSIDGSKATNSLGTGSVVIVSFSDFQCPYCKRFASETFPRLRSELIDAGAVRFVEMQFPLTTIHPLALGASAAAECARQQGKYWEMHERLFDSAALERVNLTRHASELALDPGRFGACLDSTETEAAVRRDLAEGERLGVKGTPAFFVGREQPDGSIRLFRRVNGAGSFELFSDEVKRLAEI